MRILGFFWLISWGCLVAQDTGEGGNTPAHFEPGVCKWKKELPNEVDWYVSTSLGYLVCMSGDQLYCLDGLSGNEIWRIPLKQWKRGIAEMGPSKIMEVPGTNILFMRQLKPFKDDPSKNRLPMGATEIDTKAGFYYAGIDVFSGEVLWTQPGGSSGPLLHSEVLYSNFSIFIAETFGKTGFSQCVDLRTGEQLWKKTLQKPAKTYFRFLNDEVFLRQVDDKLGAYSSKDNDKLWKFDIGKEALEVCGNTMILGRKKLTAHSLAEHREKAVKRRIWETKLGNGLGKVTQIAGKNGTLYVCAERGFAGLDEGTGKAKWSILTGKSRAFTVSFSPNATLALGATYQKANGKRFVLFDAVSGNMIGELPGKDSGVDFFRATQDHASEWISDSLVMIETEDKLIVYEVAENGSGVILKWEAEHPDPPLYPEQIDEEKKRKKQKMIFFLVAVVAGSLGDAVGDVNLRSALNGIAAGAATVEAAIAIQEFIENRESVSDTLDSPGAQKAFERFKKRVATLDPSERINVVEVDNAYRVQIRDLKTGQVKWEHDITTRGEAKIDAPFKLVYQRDYDNKKLIRAFIMPGHTQELIENFNEG